MAAICGLDKWTSPLEVWHTKVGRPAPRRDDSVLNEAALMGHRLEPIVAERFAEITGLRVFPGPGTLRAIDPDLASRRMTPQYESTIDRDDLLAARLADRIRERLEE